MLGPSEQQSALEEAYKAAAEAVETFPALLGQLEWWQAVPLIPLGLVSLLYGLKLFKGMVVVYAAMAGVLVGRMAAAWLELNPAVGMIGGAVVLGLLAWPLFKVAVTVFGGVAGGLLGALLLCWKEEPVYVLVAGGIGLVVGCVLALFVFRAVVVFMTSLIGALLVVLGVVGLVTAVPNVHDAVISGVEARRYLLPILVGVPAVIGAIYQSHRMEMEEKKRRRRK